MLLGSEQRNSHVGVSTDLVEYPGRVPETEVPGPATEEEVDLPHHLFDRRNEPGPHREKANAVSGMLHRPLGGPTSKEYELARPPAWVRAHEPMVKAEKIKPRLTLDQLHDPRLLGLGLEAQVVEERGEPRQGCLCLAPVPAHHQQIVGIPDQLSVCRTPGPIESKAA